MYCRALLSMSLLLEYLDAMIVGGRATKQICGGKESFEERLF